MFCGPYQFPLCARCTGILCGYLLGGVLLGWYLLPISVCLLSAVLLFSDWLIQYIGLLPSTNLRRLFTGIFCGMGYEHILVRIGISACHLLLR